MGVLWLLSMTIIFHTTQHITALPCGNQPEPTTTPANKCMNENKTASISEEHPMKKSSSENSEENMREKRGTLTNENIENELEKGDMMKNRFTIWDGKITSLPVEKRAKFSSWGGKRSNQLENNDLDEFLDEHKRARFSSWGGKRAGNGADMGYLQSVGNFDEITDDKRSKFNSWAGKRMDIGDNKRAKFSSWAGKRARFNSWAGKRSENFPLIDDKRTPFNSWAGKRSNEDGENDETLEEKRARFSSWAGKRSNEDGENNEASEEKRARFSSWAGKRTPDYIGNTWNRNSPESRFRYYSNGGEDVGSENFMKLWQDLMSRKRARFSSWAGKRSDASITENENIANFLEPEMEEKRARFSSWAGKRDETDSKKITSWGGKQGNESTGDLIIGREGYPGIIVKRSVFPWGNPSVAYKRKPIFSSWGGKRSDDTHTIQARSLPMQRVVLHGVKEKSWGSLLRPIRKGPDFYAWGGKRST